MIILPIILSLISLLAWLYHVHEHHKELGRPGFFIEPNIFPKKHRAYNPKKDESKILTGEVESSFD